LYKIAGWFRVLARRVLVPTTFSARFVIFDDRANIRFILFVELSKRLRFFDQDCSKHAPQRLHIQARHAAVKPRDARRPVHERRAVAPQCSLLAADRALVGLPRDGAADARQLLKEDTLRLKRGTLEGRSRPARTSPRSV
jgi:hypothetical protein